MPIHPTTETIDVGARRIPVQVYQGMVARPAPLVLHLPGGTFMRIPEHRPVAALLAEAGAVVISAAYPVGDAHPFPDALETLYALLWRLHDRRTHWAARASKLFVAGEEAGGTLAAALAMMARDRLGPPLAGHILLSPMLDAGMATCSIRDADAGPVGCKWADGWTSYLGEPGKGAHPYAAPACSSRLQGLPPALVITTTDDPMRDEAIGYAGRLREAGVSLHVRALKADDWPDALARPACPAWAAPVRTAFIEFFVATTPNLVPAASRPAIAASRT